MPNKPTPLLSKKSPWDGNANPIWLGSTITLNRNLEKYKFPGKLPQDKRKQIVSLVGKELTVCPQLEKPKIINAEDVPHIEKEFFIEHFLTTSSFQEARSGEAFVLDHSGAFLGIVNVGDHLILHQVDCTEELEAAWEQLIKIETKLNESLNFAFSHRFGYLSSAPAQCGTGLLVRVFLHLPGLIYSGKLEEATKKHKEENIEQTGLQGDPSEIIGDIVAFHNRFVLGVTEENILASLRALTTNVIIEEKRARATLKQEASSEMKDRISRAYAILLHSYQIDALEAFYALSLLKLGVDLEWVTGVDHAALNLLFFNCRRAHLLCHFSEKIVQHDLPHKRAEYIHQALKDVTLHI